MNCGSPRLVAALVLSVSGLFGAAAANEEGADTFALAMRAYAHDYYSQAFADLASLADRGHGEAARIAWLMHRHGPRLYGGHFEVEPGRAGRWLAVAAVALHAAHTVGQIDTAVPSMTFGVLVPAH
jgi:hypothetical protein